MNDHSPRACDEVESLLPLVADGSLDQRQDPLLFAHLAECERCQASLVQHDLATLAVDATLRLPRSPARRLAFPRRWWWSVATAGAAAALLLMVGGNLLVGHGEVHPHRVASAAVGGISPMAIPPAPIPDGAVAVLPDENAPSVEVTVIPGRESGQMVYLIRRGHEVVVRRAGPSEAQARTENDVAVPASYRVY